MSFGSMSFDRCPYPECSGKNIPKEHTCKPATWVHKALCYTQRIMVSLELLKHRKNQNKESEHVIRYSLLHMGLQFRVHMHVFALRQNGQGG